MSKQTHRMIERSIIALMLLGMVGMFQPFSADLFRFGFLILLFSTIGFIIVSHLSPKRPSEATIEAERTGKR